MRKFFGLIISIVVCFALSIAQAGIVEPVYKQFKSPNLDNEDDNPSTVSVRITPDGKKVFAMSHLRKGQRTGEADFITSEEGDAIYIYNLTTIAVFACTIFRTFFFTTFAFAASSEPQNKMKRCFLLYIVI